jgi:hypothetical protein
MLSIVVSDIYELLIFAGEFDKVPRIGEDLPVWKGIYLDLNLNVEYGPHSGDSRCGKPVG